MIIAKKRIPKGWRLVKIKDFAETVSGGTPDTEMREYYDNGNIPWIKSGELKNGRIKKFENFITKKGLENSSAKLLPEKTVLVAMYGATAGQIGILEKEAATNQAICGILPNDEYDPEYLFNFLKTRTKHLLRISAGAAQPNISQEIIKNYYIKLPPLSEQKRIVAVLEVWDKYLELLKREIEIKKNIKKGLMQRMFPKKDENVPELRFKEFSGPWEEKRLKEIGKTFNGLSGKTKNDFGTGEPFITYKQIFDRAEIDIEKFAFVKINKNEKQNKAKFGDIFFTASSETPQEVGFSSVLLDKEVRPFLNSFSFGFRPNSFRILSPYFGKYFFRSYTFRKEVEKLAQGSTRFNISKKRFLKIKILLPPLFEQEKIAEVLTTADKEIEALEKKYKLIEEQRKYLLEKLVNGEIRVPEDLVINN